jgi:hypothetical protein
MSESKKVVEVVEVTRDGLLDVVKTIKHGPIVVSFIATTDAKFEAMIHLKAKGIMSNPFKGALKTNSIHGLLGFDYEVSVKNELGRQGKDMSFEAQSPTNKVHHTEWPCIKVNKDGTQLYFWIKVTSSGTPVYHLNGEVVSNEAIKPYLKPFVPSKTQEAAGVEGDGIVPRTFKIQNIASLKMGKLYVVTEYLTPQERELVTAPEYATETV